MIAGVLAEVDASVVQATAKAVLAKAMKDAASMSATLSVMAESARTSEGRWLLGSQAHAVLLGGGESLKVGSWHAAVMLGQRRFELVGWCCR